MNPAPSAPPATVALSRRTFVKRCSVAAALVGVPPWFVQRELVAAAASKRPAPAPHDRPGIALIGCGGQGRRDTLAAAHHGDVVALCDVDDERLSAAAEVFKSAGKSPALYKDFRRVLERDDVHVVINGTPDHWHSLINIGAARAKKDIYSEKPLTLTIGEGRHVIAAVRENGVILQTSSQQRSSQRFRLACELVRHGRIGPLKQANVWLPAGRREGPFPTAPVPDGFDWDTWLGQAPHVEYMPARRHGRFRFWYDYSGGTMTDWGAHHNDIVAWALDRAAPRDIQATALIEPITGGFDAHSEYTVRYTYENGVRLNLATTTDDDPNGFKVKEDGQRNGIKFEGAHGWIWVNRTQLMASDPELLKAPLPEDAAQLYRSTDHIGNFFDCVRTRRPPICDAETGHRSATLCHLGVISLRTGGLKLTWDAAREQFVGEHATLANTYVTRPMRPPFDLSYVG